jgi:hypothetical protein
VVCGDGCDARRSRSLVLEQLSAYSVYDADAQRGVSCGTEGFGRIAYQRPGQEYKYLCEEEKAVEGFVGLNGLDWHIGWGLIWWLCVRAD